MEIIIMVIAVLLFVFILKKDRDTPEQIGTAGEIAVSKQLSKLPKDEYFYVDDIIIPSKYGTTQIDHVIISPYGIFVVEMKNYQGWIYGEERKDEWIQYLYRQKSFFHNPLLQNYGHIYALAKYLNVPSKKFISIVVFSNEAKIKVNSSKHVINLVELNDTILCYNTVIFTKNEVEHLALLLKNADQPISEEERVAHTLRVRKIAEDYQSKKQMGICPRCGGRLVPRTGKYDTFFGCSNYPKCRYTCNTIN